MSSTENITESKTKHVLLLPKRGGPGNTLVWQGGRLQSILASDKTSLAHPSIAISGNIQRANFALSSIKTNMSSSVLPVIRKENQVVCSVSTSNANEPSQANNTASRRKTFLGVIEQENDINLSGSKAARMDSKPPASRPASKRSARNNASKIQPLLLPLKQHHPETNWSVPELDLMSKFGFVGSYDSEKGFGTMFNSVSHTGDENGEAPTNSTNNSSNSNSLVQATVSGRMKSSAGINDIDFEELKHYRRLNGYNLFLLVNKKKYESNSGNLTNEDSSDLNETSFTGLGTKESQKMLNRRWQALWSTLSEKSRREWKTKARRLLKHRQLQNKREVWSENRRAKERSKLETQIFRSQTTSYNLLDLAAHFQLLSDKFSSFSKQINDYTAINTDNSNQSTTDISLLKSKYEKLIEEKKLIESSLVELTAILDQNGNVGLNASLIDNEGFPRSDIDVALVRTTRNRIRCLNTDHKKIMLEIETILNELHANARKNPTSKECFVSTTADNTITGESTLSTKPFLLIDQITPNSKAAQAGLKVGDRILQFGSVSAKNFTCLQDIAKVVQNSSEETPITVVILRDDDDDDANNTRSIFLSKPTENSSLGMHIIPL